MAHTIPHRGLTSGENLKEEAGSTPTDAESSTSRVRKHRQRSRVSGNARLEVSVGADVVASVKKMARQRNCPVWKVVQSALVAYVAGNKPES